MAHLSIAILILLSSPFALANECRGTWANPAQVLGDTCPTNLGTATSCKCYELSEARENQEDWKGTTALAVHCVYPNGGGLEVVHQSIQPSKNVKQLSCTLVKEINSAAPAATTQQVTHPQ
jgi:hypothetical protein